MCSDVDNKPQAPIEYLSKNGLRILYIGKIMIFTVSYGIDKEEEKIKEEQLKAVLLSIYYFIFSLSFIDKKWTLIYICIL